MEQMDNRANARLTIRDDVTLKTERILDDQSCVLENISKGGIKFFSKQKLSIGNLVRLLVPSPDDSPDILIDAKIVRLDVGCYGQPYGYACTITSTHNV